jgi:RluA family pseudouridine synthase
MPSHRQRRLDDVLAEWLPAALGRPLSKAALRRLIMAGAIRSGGRPLRQPGRLLTSGLLLEASVDLARLPAPSPSGPVTIRDGAVLYEDAALIAVDKPAGLPTHPTADAARPNLWAAVRQRLAKGGPLPYLGIHQRLDRDTSGVVLFSKDPAANAGLAKAFAERGVVKTYWALTARPARLPAAAWRVDDRLGPVGSGRRQVIGRVASGALAETHFTRLEAFDHGLLVEAQPRTGRKHQIRVHLAGAGLPILGDAAYGATACAGVPRVMLHALRLSFVHPLTEAPVVIESPCPPDFVHVLQSLRAGVNVCGGRASARRR